jgi:two-component system, NarL family, nitrate/nitrite response regulator NarL
MFHALIIEDHPLFRQALSQLLRNTLGADIMLTADAEQGLTVLKENQTLNLVVMDLGLPGLLNGYAAVSAVRQQHATIPILVVSGSDDADTKQAVLDAGANAYLVKTATATVFENTLKQLVGHHATSSHQRLTSRQREILLFLCEGLSNKEIGRKLKLSDATVKMHMTAVLRALGVHTRTQAVLSAKQLGLDVTTQDV